MSTNWIIQIKLRGKESIRRILEEKAFTLFFQRFFLIYFQPRCCHLQRYFRQLRLREYLSQ